MNRDMSETTLRVLRVIDGTSVDGPGLRTSIYLAGCDHRCPGCHNPQSWDFAGGTPMTVDRLVDIIAEADFDVTLSGGDPLYQLDGVIELARRVKALGKNLWCYTGFTYEEILADERLSRVLPWIDTLVDGPFVQALRDPELIFRGSSNQRILHLR
jgi:anaerobic ribonucleoside-triphosphate reductase activating protein